MKTKVATCAVVVLFALGLLTISLEAQIAACYVPVSCGNYSQWYATCLPPLPPGVFNCSGFDFTEYCEIATYECPPPPCPTCDQAGNPINLATGNTYIQQSDVALPGVGGGLNLTRTWNSIPGRSVYGMFGHQWTSNFEEQIGIGADGMIEHSRGDGATLTYGFGGGYGSTGGTPTFSPAAPLNSGAILVYNGYIAGFPSWALTSKNGELRVFTGPVGANLIAPPPCPLVAIIDRNGNTTALGYNSGLLTTVTDAASRHLYFSYGSVSVGGFSVAVVTSVTSDFGVSLSYQYDNMADLVQVTKPDATFVSFAYNPAGLLTTVKDSNGKLLESHTYDALGRGLTSSRAGGVDSVTISY